MVKLLEPDKIDEINEQVDATMTLDEERIAAGLGRFDPSKTAPDLSDGGMVGSARIRPMQNGRTLEKGRPAARRVWMWNGTESLIPLAWNPDGTVHDGGRRYLTKRHCHCCYSGGFRGGFCLNCRKNNCDKCNASTVAKNIIPLFYLRKEDVPYPTQFFGNVDCFLEECPRRGTKGFLTKQGMMVHADSKHSRQWRAHLQELSEQRRDDMDILKQQVADLLAEKRSNGNKAASRPSLDGRTRAAKKQKAAAGVA